MINWNNLLEGKVIVIHGGTRGIGRLTAIEAAAQGADIVIGGRNEEKAAEVISEIEKLGRRAFFVRVDPLSHPEDCSNLIKQAIEKYGKVDGLYCYTGIVPSKEIVDTTPEFFNQIMEVNAMSTTVVCGEAIKFMKEHGGGSIVITGSPEAWSGDKDHTAYAMSKGALKTLAEHITKHYAADHIRCNYMVMGWVATDGEIAMRKEMGMTEAELHKFAEPFIPMGRMQTPEDHVPGIIYFLSDLSEQVTGSILRVSGGLYI